MSDPKHSPLGKIVKYKQQYDPSCLYPIPRKPKRAEIGLDDNALPFCGYDMWRAYEFSWLDFNGKPRVAILEFYIPCDSKYILESKSLKLYLFSFSNEKFGSFAKIAQIIKSDLKQATGSKIILKKIDLDSAKYLKLAKLQGICLDNQKIKFTTYDVDPGFLKAEDEIVTETLYSNLLKSNCLITGQPDWGSIQIHYTGHKISRVGLLKYIVSFRNHHEFHEQCIERIFNDILINCNPQKLAIFGFYTRRGGLDINPVRATTNISILSKHIRLHRQ